MFRDVLRVVVVCFAAVLTAAPVFGQGAVAEINGSAVDQTGAALPGATLTITEESTGLTRTAIANESGRFVIPAVTPGRYTITLAGGRAFPIDLRYGENISSWLSDAERGIPSIEQEVAWSGRTAAGNDVLLQLIRWKNPQPETIIESIELSSAGGRASPVVFAITALGRCP